MAKKKQKNDYFDLLTEMSKNIKRSARFLKKIVEKFDPDFIQEMMEDFHELEHAADQNFHDLNRKLAREFITPIEREDISKLASVIDDVIDAMEDIVIRFYMFDVKELRPEAYEFADLLERQGDEITAMMKEFKNFKRSEEVRNGIIEVNHLEEEGDALFVRAMRRLYTEDTLPIDALRWTEVFRRMEMACDRCEDVAIQVENVIMKNS